MVKGVEQANVKEEQRAAVPAAVQIAVSGTPCAAPAVRSTAFTVIILT